MGKTNLDELVLSGNLTAANIAASGTLEYDSLAVTGDATVGGTLEITQGVSAAQVSSSGDVLAIGDIVANGELRAYDNVTFGEVANPVTVTVNGTISAASLSTTGDVTVGDDLTVTGDTELTGTLTALNDVTIGAEGALKTLLINGDIETSGIIIQSTLTLSGAPNMSGITDAHFAVTTANATDETSAIALANANKAAINKLVKYLRTGSTT